MSLSRCQRLHIHHGHHSVSVNSNTFFQLHRLFLFIVFLFLQILPLSSTSTACCHFRSLLLLLSVPSSTETHRLLFFLSQSCITEMMSDPGIQPGSKKIKRLLQVEKTSAAPVVQTVEQPSNNEEKDGKQHRRHLHSKLLGPLVPKPLNGTGFAGFQALFLRNGRKENRVTDDQSNRIYVPLDIIYEIAKYLNRVDYAVLRYACRNYYYMLPPPREHLMADNCGRSHLLSRLVDTCFFPKIYLKNGNTPLMSPLTSEDVKKQLYWKQINNCQLCNRLSFDDSFDMCPLHRQFDNRPKLPASRTHLELAFLFFGWSKGFGFHRIKTREAYYSFLEKIAAAGYYSSCPSDSSSSTTCAPSSSNSSPSYILCPDDNSFPDSWLDYAYEFSRSRTDPRRTREIIRLNCCCHCLNILPEKPTLVSPSASASASCFSCDCSLCGWAPVDILRLKVGDSPGSVFYVPLGIMRDREESGLVKRRLFKMIRGNSSH